MYINLLSAAVSVTFGCLFHRPSFCLKKDRPLKSVCLILLILNLIKYIRYPFVGRGIVFPVEFSSVSYFTVPIIVLFSIEPLKVWATYSSLLAGGGYIVVTTLFGSKFFSHYNIFSFILSLFCHTCLLFIGLCLLRENSFKESRGWILTCGFIIMLIRVMLLKNYFMGGKGIFIYELLYGYFPASIMGIKILPFYYLFLFILLFLSFKIFFKLSQKKKA